MHPIMEYHETEDLMTKKAHNSFVRNVMSPLFEFHLVSSSVTRADGVAP